MGLQYNYLWLKQNDRRVCSCLDKRSLLFTREEYINREEDRICKMGDECNGWFLGVLQK